MQSFGRFLPLKLVFSPAAHPGLFYRFFLPGRFVYLARACKQYTARQRRRGAPGCLGRCGAAAAAGARAGSSSQSRRRKKRDNHRNKNPILLDV